MLPRHRLRQIVNWLTLSTPFGLLLAVLGRARISRQRDGLFIAEQSKLMLPDAGAFTVGNVIITGRPWEVMVTRYPDLLAHETAHSSQWAWLGPLFLPLYVVWMGWSMIRTGDRASRNYLERWAGLVRGGYREKAIRRLRPIPPSTDQDNAPAQ